MLDIGIATPSYGNPNRWASVVYFIRPWTGGPIKIGFTGHLRTRLSALRKTYGCPLRVVHCEFGRYEDEIQYHHRFADLRFGMTEQYRPGKALTDFLGLPEDPNWERVEALPKIVKPRKVSA